MTEQDLMNLVYRGYLAALTLIAGGIVLAYWRRLLDVDPIPRTAAVLLGNWALSTAFIIATGVNDPWYWYFIIDLTAARIVLHQPAFRPQAMIGGIYAAQVAAHLIYAASVVLGQPASQNKYWQILIALAIVQVIVLGGWCVGMGGRILLGRWRGSRVAHPQGGGRVA